MKMLGIRSKSGNTVFSNLLFNAEVLTANHQQIRGQSDLALKAEH